MILPLGLVTSVSLLQPSKVRFSSQGPVFPAGSIQSRGSGRGFILTSRFLCSKRRLVAGGAFPLSRLFHVGSSLTIFHHRLLGFNEFDPFIVSKSPPSPSAAFGRPSAQLLSCRVPLNSSSRHHAGKVHEKHQHYEWEHSMFILCFFSSLFVSFKIKSLMGLCPSRRQTKKCSS